MYTWLRALVACGALGIGAAFGACDPAKPSAEGAREPAAPERASSKPDAAPHADAAPPEPRPPSLAIPTHKPWNMAHRGGAKIYPANTLVAFQHAVKEHGIDVLELDVHRTKDGVVVVQHDPVMDTTTDCKGKVLELTLSEYRKCNTVPKFSPAKGVPNRFVGQKIPHATLEEIFKAFPSRWINIEIKQYDPPITAEVVALIENYKRADKVIVASTSGPTLQDLRKRNGAIRTNLSIEEILLFIRARKASVLLDEYKAPGQALQVPTHMVDADFVKDAHAKGMEVHVWTVDDEATMEKLLKLGVDGIITDRPDLMAAVLKRFLSPP